jgi:hypothetical protein
MAERVGFEPTVRLRAHRFSRPAHSTTLPPLHDDMVVRLIKNRAKKNHAHSNATSHNF